ncbi:hypothetical protein Ancab_000780 [Ancistrocladus abbreviatus]
MALEAVVYHQALFGHNNTGSKDPFNLLLENWGSDLSFPKEEEQEELLEQQYGSYEFLENQTEHFPSPFIVQNPKNNDQWASPIASLEDNVLLPNAAIPVESMPLLGAASSGAGAASSARPRRRRARSRKNREEIEHQRMTHIAVERNRRKQMNEYLSVLRSLMPESYVQRGDQASIIGGAINFVKELEQNLQSLSAQKHAIEGGSSSWPFGEFFTFPQYSTSSVNEMKGQTCQSGLADVEVTMLETHANLKIRMKWQPKQLLKILSGLQSLRLVILHLNATTVDQVALYTLNVKVEGGSKLSSVDEIATAVYHMLSTIHEEAHWS